MPQFANGYCENTNGSNNEKAPDKNAGALYIANKTATIQLPGEG